MEPPDLMNRDHISEMLRSQGFRMTPQRDKILDIFFQLPEGEHLSAEDLQNMLRKELSDISLATSYRTLKLLASMGVLREVDFDEDHKHYELARHEGGTPHQHIFCTTCGKAEEFTTVEVFETAMDIAAGLGFEFLDAQLKITGRCSACRKDGF